MVGLATRGLRAGARPAHGRLPGRFFSGRLANAACNGSITRDGALLNDTNHQHLLTQRDLGHQLSVVAVLTARGYRTTRVVSAETPVVMRPAKAFSVTATPTSIGRKATFTVTGNGLDAGEAYSIRLGTKQLATGTASSTGVAQRKLTMPATTPLGQTQLVVTGSQTNRTGAVTVTVLRAR